MEPSTDLIPTESPELALTETERVELWRLETLLRNGYPQPLAEQIAARNDIELHLATQLLERGCEPELATRILL